MSKLYWLSEEQLDRISPYFPPSRGVARVDDRRVISGIIYVIKNGLRWCDAPLDYGPYKTLYNRFKRWSVLGVFDPIFTELSGQCSDKPSYVAIDATYLKAHRTAASLLKKGMFPVLPGEQKVA